MDDDRNPGKLHFITRNVDEEIGIYWNMLSGGLEQKSWNVSVSFAKDFSVPGRALGLLTNALENSAVQVVFELQDGRKFECVIHSILDQADSGVIEIASPEQWRARFI